MGETKYKPRSAEDRRLGKIEAAVPMYLMRSYGH